MISVAPRLAACNACRQAAVAATGVAIPLCHPIPDRLRSRFELMRQRLRRAASAHQLNHLATELKWVGYSCLGHCGLLEPK